MMKKQYIVATLLVSLSLSTFSCSQGKDEPEVIGGSESTQQLFYMEAEADEIPYELADTSELRSFDYDLQGDFQRPVINFGGAAENKAIPVHAFFKNAKTQALVHAVLYFDEVKGTKTIRRNYAPVNLNGKYTEDSKDDWYVKMFIGVYPELSTGGNWPAHDTSLMTNPNVNQVRILKDELWDLGATSTSFSIPDNYYTVGKWGTYNPRPLPMETAWTKTSFSADLNTTQAENRTYRTTNVTFRPVGSLLRIRFNNQSPDPVSFNSFSLTGAERNVSVANPSQLVNHVVLRFDANITVTDGVVTNAGYTELGQSDGRVHYHYPSLSARQVTSNSSRVAFVWVKNNAGVSGTQMLRPTFYTCHNDEHAYVNGSTPYFKAVARNAVSYTAGKTYRANFTYRVVDIEAGLGQWEHSGDATIGGVALD